jgi:hypothetical protein
MKTLKEMKNEIKEKYYAVPERQISTGIYLEKVGRKYVTLLNTWNRTTVEKVEIEYFYNEHF